MRFSALLYIPLLLISTIILERYSIDVTITNSITSSYDIGLIRNIMNITYDTAYTILKNCALKIYAIALLFILISLYITNELMSIMSKLYYNRYKSKLSTLISTSKSLLTNNTDADFYISHEHNLSAIKFEYTIKIINLVYILIMFLFLFECFSIFIYCQLTQLDAIIAAASIVVAFLLCNAALIIYHIKFLPEFICAKILAREPIDL